MNERIVIIGGGFGGARIAQDLVKAGFTDVTLIDRKDYFEISYVAIHTLMNPASLHHSRKAFRDFLKSKFIQAEVSELTKTEVRLADGRAIPFDTVIVTTGSSFPKFPIGKSNDALNVEDRHAEFEHEKQRLEAADNILIIGGGPIGVELAGEITHNYPRKNVTLAEASSNLLGFLKPGAGTIAHAKLKARGVNILYNTRLTEEDEIYKNAKIVYTCVGLTPNTDILRPQFLHTLNGHGFVKVDRYFRAEGTENIYALGDCSTVPGFKLGFFANIQGAHLVKNLVRESQGKSPKPYKPWPGMALVLMGGGVGVGQFPLIGVTTFGPLIRARKNDPMIKHQFRNLSTNI